MGRIEGSFQNNRPQLPFTMWAVLLAAFFATVKGAEQPKVVYPRLLEERSADGRMALHIHDGLTLNLRKASVAAEEFRVLKVEDGHEVTHFYNGKDLEEHIYEDEKELATVHVNRKETGVEVEGVLGAQQRIKPMQTTQRSDDGLVPHLVYTIENQEMLDNAILPNKIGAPVLKERSYGSRTVPSIFEVEMFIVTDSAHYSYFNSTQELLVYLLITVNSVNLRYTDITSPKIMFLLTGVEQNKGETYKSGNGNYMHDSPTLGNFKLYAETKRHDHGYPDFVYLMTGREVYMTDNSGRMNTNGLGIGYVAGVCTTFNVALGEDKAGFHTGMHTLTHEAAHVLGSAHDESPPVQNVPGHPGSKTCLWSSGYIMSYINNGPNHHRFSTCSMEQIRYVVRLRGQACWRVGKRGETPDHRYPGMMVPQDDFCRRLIPHKTNVTADANSPSLQKCKVRCQYREPYTFFWNNRYYNSYRIYYMEDDALDYMSCGQGKVCVRGYCISDSGSTTGVTSRPRVTTTTRPTTTPSTTTSVLAQTTVCDCNTTTPKPGTRTNYRYNYRGNWGGTRTQG
ncbi:venom metalloproteinase BumaMPs1-like [Haemaphysalis longicornis]